MTAEERIDRGPGADDGSGGVGDEIVVDGEEPVGTVTLDDVVATIGEDLDDVASVIERQSGKYEPSADAKRAPSSRS